MKNPFAKLFTRRKPSPVTIDTIRTQARAKTAPVTALRDATTAALAGRPDASVNYSNLIAAWDAPLPERKSIGGKRNG